MSELKEITNLTPDSYFLSCNKYNPNELSLDFEYYYVNVIPKNSTIRVLVYNAKWPNWYAVSAKNIQ